MIYAYYLRFILIVLLMCRLIWHILFLLNIYLQEYFHDRPSGSLRCHYRRPAQRSECVCPITRCCCHCCNASILLSPLRRPTRTRNSVPTSAEQVLASMDGMIAAVLDGGPCGVGTESTILRVDEHSAEILRSGPISAEMLQPYLQIPVHTPSSHEHAVSGNKKIHYQPNARITLCKTDEITALAASAAPHSGALVYSTALRSLPCHHLKVMPADHQGYRQALYAACTRPIVTV